MDGGAPPGGNRKKPRTIIVGAAGMALSIKLRMPRLQEEFDLVRDDASRVGA